MPRKRKKIYVDVPYHLKNAAKTIGAIWDNKEKKWFIYDTFDVKALMNLLENDRQKRVKMAGSGCVAEFGGVSLKFMSAQGFASGVNSKNTNFDKKINSTPPYSKNSSCPKKTEFDTADVLLKFKMALNEAGLEVDTPIMDGVLRRVRVSGDRGSQKSGAYVGYSDGLPAGFIQNFKSGFSSNWKYEFLALLPYSDDLVPLQNVAVAKNSAVLNSEFEYHRSVNTAISKDFNNASQTQNITSPHSSNHNKNMQNFAQKQLEQEQILENKYEKTAQILLDEFLHAPFARLNHPYFAKKGIDKDYGLRQDRFGNLLMPLFDVSGKFWSVQRIFSNGDKMIGVLPSKQQKENGKKFLAKKRGNFYILSDDNDLYNTNLATLNLSTLAKYREIYLCEGFATAVSVYQASSVPVVVGVDAGNLEFVVQNLQANFANINIIIAADNDVKNEKKGRANVGKEKALHIKNNYKNISVCLPKFNDDEMDLDYSDFNDLHKSRGLEEVGRQLKIIL